MNNLKLIILAIMAIGIMVAEAEIIAYMVTH